MEKITKIGKKGLDLIKKWEGFRSKPYLCPAGVPTIGYGSTRYDNGKRVNTFDREITEKRAEELLLNTLSQFELAIDAYCRDEITQNQFDALVSLCYNIGAGNFKSSTLLKLVNNNPNDPKIRDAFMLWCYAAKIKLKGLEMRRQEEADLYFTV